VVRTYCESTPMLIEYLRAQDIDVERRTKPAPNPTSSLCRAGVGVALLPRSTRAPDSLLRLMVEKLELIGRSISMASPDANARCRLT